GIWSIEGADGERGVAILAPLVGERGAALVTEAPKNPRGGAEICRPAAGPLDRRLEMGERRHEVAEGLLAHAAVTDRGVVGWALDMEAHRAALATAGEGFGHMKSLPAKRSVAMIRWCRMPGWEKAWPAPSTITNSASGRALC